MRSSNVFLGPYRLGDVCDRHHLESADGFIHLDSGHEPTGLTVAPKSSLRKTHGVMTMTCLNGLSDGRAPTMYSSDNRSPALNSDEEKRENADQRATGDGSGEYRICR